jgi:hypothetical protein
MVGSTQLFLPARRTHIGGASRFTQMHHAESRDEEGREISPPACHVSLARLRCQMRLGCDQFMLSTWSAGMVSLIPSLVTSAMALNATFRTHL